MQFSVITRTLAGREALLDRCQASVRSQTLQDVEHIVIRDEVGIGVSAAQKLLWDVTPQGEYVLVLDDDDYLSGPDVLERVAAEIKKPDPPFVVVKVAHHEMGEMPRKWGERPAQAEITVSNVLIANWLWMRNRQQFTPEYVGDFKFIDSLFDGAYRCQWIDVEVVTVEQRRMGEAS